MAGDFRYDIVEKIGVLSEKGTKPYFMERGGTKVWYQRMGTWTWEDGKGSDTYKRRTWGFEETNNIDTR